VDSGDNHLQIRLTPTGLPEWSSPTENFLVPKLKKTTVARLFCQLLLSNEQVSVFFFSTLEFFVFLVFSVLQSVRCEEGIDLTPVAPLILSRLNSRIGLFDPGYLYRIFV
jgi:hypothetical protein